MKKVLGIIAFIAAVAALFYADDLLAHHNPIVNSNIFVQNDFEITQHDHPEEVWDKVFFGNSVVLSSYIENRSRSRYVNCGIDDGVVTDLRDMLYGNWMKVGRELVLGSTTSRSTTSLRPTRHISGTRNGISRMPTLSATDSIRS